jgi:hypothetical protein
MNGTASLANGEIGRVLLANYRKVPFSGVAKHLNEAATARYFGQLSGESPETRTAWRMRQSRANPSLGRISLLAGKNAGNLLFSAAAGRKGGKK